MISRLPVRILLALVALAVSASAADLAHLRNGFSIRHERRQTLGDRTRLYLAADGSDFVDVPTADILGYEHDDSPPPADPAAAAAPQPFDVERIIGRAAGLHQIDPDFLRSVIRAESAFNPRAVSPKGALGLMQLMPSTAGRLGVTNPFQPEANVEGGTRYLRQLLIDYHGDAIKALAAYNAGPERVAQYGGVPPYRETHAYVARVITDYNRRKKAKVPASASPAKPAK